MRSARVVGMRSLLAIAAVPSVSPVDSTPLGRLTEIEARCRRLSHLAAEEEIRSLYSGSRPRAPGIDGRPQPPTGNERP